LMAMRLGGDPRMLLTTTPRNVPALKALMAAPDVAVTVSRTADNAANLAEGFYDLMLARYGNSTLGRQELDGDLIEDQDGALWKREWIEAARVLPLARSTEGGGGCSWLSSQRKPEGVELERIVVAVDPPASAHGDECGIVVVGRSVRANGSDQNRSVRESGSDQNRSVRASGSDQNQNNGQDAYVLADRSAGSLTPAGWAARVMQACADFEADAVIAEANQGGEMVRSVLQQADAASGVAVPVRLVHATRGKLTRAAPAAALYEAGRVHHMGCFAELEDQMCHYDGSKSAKSPDRMDALVWALADLFGARCPQPKIRKL